MEKKIVNRLAFIQSKCGICLFAKHRFASSLHDFQWHQVCRIIKYSSNESGGRRDREQCTICLGEPWLPRMDRCGHLFCLCCLLELLRHHIGHGDSVTTPPTTLAQAVAALSRVTVLCPFCKDLEIGLATVKRVTLKESCPLPRSQDFVSFSLLVKSSGQACPRFAHHYDNGNPPMLPTTGSPLASFVSVTFDNDRHWSRLIERDMTELERHRDRFPQQCLEVAMAILREELARSVATGHDHHNHHDDDSDDGNGDEGDVRVEGERDPTPSGDELRRPLADRFNLLMPLPSNNEQHQLFYQSAECRGGGASSSLVLLLDPAITRTVLEQARRAGRAPPTALRARLACAPTAQLVDRAFLALSRLGQLVPGTTVWIARIRWDSLLVTPLTEREHGPLERQLYEMREQDRLAERHKQQIAQRAAVMKHLGRPSRHQTSDEALLSMPRSIITGFNTCTLGIPCVAPDDDYPHAETCEHFKPPPIDATIDEVIDRVSLVDRVDCGGGGGDAISTPVNTSDHGNMCGGGGGGCEEDSAVKDSGIETGSSDGSTADDSSNSHHGDSDRSSLCAMITAAGAGAGAGHSLMIDLDVTQCADHCRVAPVQIDTASGTQDPLITPSQSPRPPAPERTRAPCSTGTGTGTAAKPSSSEPPPKPQTFPERMRRQQQNVPRPPEMVTNPWEVPKEDAHRRFVAAYVVDKKPSSQRLLKQQRKKATLPRPH